MELHEYWQIIRRRWWLVAAITAVALIAAAATALRGATAYTTEMTLAVSTVPTQPTASELYYDPIYYSNLDSEYLADDLSEFLQSTDFAHEVSDEMAHATPPVPAVVPGEISNVTRAEKTHRFIDVKITTPTFEEGQDIAASMQRIVNDPARMQNYMTALGAYNTHVNVVTPPFTVRGSLPALASEVGLRTLVGIIIGIGLAFLLDYLDLTVRGRRDVESVLGIPVLAEIPRLRRTNGVA